jgi:SAM-dependent methyltransferase
MSDRNKWDRRYRDSENTAPAPAQVLRDFTHLLPVSGAALDLAAGLGGNALLLAGQGLTTMAWDISPVAMAKLTACAERLGLAVECQARDVVAEPPETERFDVIVVSRFLERQLCPHLAAALRPGGLLFYQTFVQEKTEPGFGPSNPAYLLARNELLRLFPSLQLIAYREEGVVGRPDQGLRNEAYLVAQRP